MITLGILVKLAQVLHLVDTRLTHTQSKVWFEGRDYFSSLPCTQEYTCTKGPATLSMYTTCVSNMCQFSQSLSHTHLSPYKISHSIEKLIWGSHTLFKTQPQGYKSHSLPHHIIECFSYRVITFHVFVIIPKPQQVLHWDTCIAWNYHINNAMRTAIGTKMVLSPYNHTDNKCVGYIK